jgi:hypothetical protein
MTKYRCINNPDHVYDKPTDDLWCTQCDISSNPMLEPFEEEPVPSPVQPAVTDNDTDFVIDPVIQNDTEPAPINVEPQIELIPLNEDNNQQPDPVIIPVPDPILVPDPVFLCEEASYGNQIWMLKFLSVTEFRNGESIVHAKDEKEWKKAKLERTPAWCYAGFEGNEGKDYGILYNYYAVSHPSGLAPHGWRIPNLKDIESLAQISPSDFIAGHIDHFQETGMNHRLAMGSYIQAGEKRIFWTSERKLVYTAYSFEVAGSTGEIKIKQYDKSAGFFVRCLKEI